MPETADQVVETLRSRGYCTDPQLQEGLEIQQKMRDMGISPKPLAEILLDKGYLTKDQFREVSQKPLHDKASLDKDSIPGYELMKKIGQGGMGAVFQARQLSMDRVVALKVLPPKLAKDPNFRERFLREARAVAKLNHENIIQGIDVGISNGLYYFVMEFVDGRTVSKHLAETTTLPEKDALRICGQIARALEHAWRHKLVHRDVKPENIMTTGEGVAKLCDLGLAKQETGDVGLTQAGLSVGTPNYISPEQARGEADVDIRSDLYSLGASLYHMLTGKVPFDGTVPSVVMTKHITEELVPPSKHRADLSPEAVAIVMKAMQKRREDRYQEPSQMAADLEAAATGKPLIHAKVISASKRYPGQAAAGGPPPAALPSSASGTETRKPLHALHAAGPSKASVVAPIVIATVVALAILGGVIVANRGKKAAVNPGSGNTASGTGTGKTPDPGDSTKGTTAPTDVAAEREKKIEQEFKALTGFIEGNQGEVGRHGDIESRLEEFISAHRKTEWENRAIAEQKKFRDGLDKSAQALLARIVAEVEPIRKDGRTFEAYSTAQSKWAKHLDSTPTAKKFQELLSAIDAELQAAWVKDRDAAKALADQHEFEKAVAGLDVTRKYASPQVQALADALKVELKRTGEEYTAKLAETGRKRYDSEFWPALEKLLFERKYKDALTHCGKFMNDPEMAVVKDKVMAMLDDISSLNLVLDEAGRGAETAAKTKEPVTIKKFEVRITNRDGDRVGYAFLNGGSSELQILKADEADIAVLCQVAYNALPQDQKAAEKGPFEFRIGLLFYFTSDDKDKKRAGEELEKASRDGVVRAKWYLDRMAERGMGDVELAAKKVYDEAFDLFGAKKYAEAKPRFQRLLSDMATTAWVRDHKTTIQQRIAECDAKLGAPDSGALAALFKGTLKPYARGAIEVHYDFSTADQLQDFTVAGGTWTWDKDTQSIHGQAGEDVLRGLNWNAPLTGDLSLEMDIVPVAERGIGISVHNDAAGHSYLAIFGGLGTATAQQLGNPDLKSLALTKFSLGGTPPFSVLGSLSDPKAVKGQSMKVRISRAGRGISVYVGGKRLLEGQDDAWTKGQVVLFLQGGEARFDNLTIFGTPDDAWLKAHLPGGK
ncbi:MAG: serine/threonine protein kinase [Planctomycetes bacterium]|nr:serine/threonine protein kinase [Planctomycetota bacterium]